MRSIHEISRSFFEWQGSGIARHVSEYITVKTDNFMKGKRRGPFSALIFILIGLPMPFYSIFSAHIVR